jgi:hypothetical protein
MSQCRESRLALRDLSRVTPVCLSQALPKKAAIPTITVAIPSRIYGKRQSRYEEVKHSRTKIHDHPSKPAVPLI